LQLFFEGTGVFTKLKVSSTVTSWSREYKAMIDTGAFNTAIPLADIKLPNVTPTILNLKYLHTHQTSGVNLDGLLDVYEATLLVGEEDEYRNVPVVGAPMKWAVIGREIMKLFKWEIDWKLKTVKISKNWT
jgi:hypothetical protein